MVDVNSNELNSGAIILAGGDSKRLGRPKALLEFDGKSLIKLIIDRLQYYFNRLTVVTDRPELYTDLPVFLIEDILKDQVKSPLRGIHAGLAASSLSRQFVVACDMPFLNMSLIKYMASLALDCDAVVPRVGTYYQPLHAFYNRSCIPVIEEQLKSSHFKVTDFYARLSIRYVCRKEISRFDPDECSFININTWEDYEKALVLFRHGEKAAQSRNWRGSDETIT